MKFHQVISGFTQTRRHVTGLDKVYIDLLELSNPTTIINFSTWKDDWVGVADWIQRLCQDEDPKTVDIRCYAYSWGCGHGFIDFAKELNKRGLGIKKAVLSDPVYYNPFFKWQAMWSLWTHRIFVPNNVKEVHYFRQMMNKPAGHELIGGSGTEIKFEGYLNYTHQNMDDSWEFHKLCKEIARES